MKADDLVAAQRLEERLKAAVDEAPQDGALDFHAADSRRAGHLLERRYADEADLYALCRLSLTHAWQAMDSAPA